MGKDEISDGIDAEMKPVNEDPNPEDLKDQSDDGVKPTKFGNTMLLISVLALLMAYAYMEVQIIRANSKKKKSESKANTKVTGVGKAQIGGEWELIGTDGKPVSSKDLEGKYYLIYFGFTHCPDICPNSLTKLAKAVAKVKKTKEANFFDLKTVFISVDPDRDSA
jgi:cytochrome oxidase Cu insertion factor (SCO1/SenC/PrrC family)